MQFSSIAALAGNPAVSAGLFIVCAVLAVLCGSARGKNDGFRRDRNKLELEILRLSDLANTAEKKAESQRAAFVKFHNDRVSRLKQEVLRRQKLIRKLQEELTSIKERSKAEDIAKDIRVLESENNALSVEISKETKLSDHQAVPQVDSSVEEIYRLKDRITELSVENSRLHSLNAEYQRRYNDVLTFGNRIKLEKQDLEGQVQELLMKLSSAKAN